MKDRKHIGSSRPILLVALLTFMFSSGCATRPPVNRSTGYTQSAGDKATSTALTMIGRPYKYRGETPAGFDCSGLVRYSYLTAGIELPHGTRALKDMTRSVGLWGARQGDLVFFWENGKKYSHVGIYIGDRKFIHAPSTGGNVRRDSVDDPYYKKHYLDTRRLM